MTRGWGETARRGRGEVGHRAVGSWQRAAGRHGAWISPMFRDRLLLLPPISWLAMEMSNCDDKQLFTLDPVNQAVGKSLQEIPPIFSFINWPK